MSMIYRKAINILDKAVPSKFQPFWNHPAGPKTIFFWAPAIKWGLVGAGIGDLARPVEKVSISQSGALAATGLVWSRYSLVIIPKNWSLFAVNVFVASSALYQVGRALRYLLPEIILSPDWCWHLVAMGCTYSILTSQAGIFRHQSNQKE